MKRKRLSNTEIAQSLREMSLFLEMEETPFKPQAYENAAHVVGTLDRPLADLYADGGEKALDGLPGIGSGIARRIGEMLRTGKMADLEALRKKIPVDILSLTAIEGIGAKMARTLWRELGIRSVADLKQAAEAGRVRVLPHFGEKSEQRILRAIAFLEESAGRRPLGEVLDIAKRIEAALAALPGVAQVVVAGSIRRHRETIGDVDVLVAATDPAQVSRAFQSLPEVQAVIAEGPTKTLARLSVGLDADLRVLAPRSFGAALLYFTGSKAHSVALRKIAQRQGLKLNEYGLFRGPRAIGSRTEEEIYKALGLSWIPPEMREDEGEIELARRGALPAVVSPADIRGDLHVHTKWSDGSASIREMAQAARRLGHQYIAITDHTRDLAVTGGLDRDELRAQIKEVRKVDRELGGVRVLAGAEVNIRADGTLDMDDDVLAELDLVGAAIHSHFEQTRTDLTRRIVRAVENPHVDILFHPAGRALGHRRPLDFDFGQVLEASVRSGTVLEINGQPGRLDLPDSMVRRAVEAGARIAIDSDAHTPDELRFISAFGVGVGRRGWAERRHVVNTRPFEALRGLLKA
jgi:DNA polymerase (family 10)